jgi:RNA polymerase sigma factor (sigma-70 family)
MTFLDQQAALIEKAKSGDEASFEVLILNCKTKAYNTALRYLRDEEDALDALQESLIKVYRHLGQFKGDCKFDTWVYRIVVNTCNDVLRKKRPYQSVQSIYQMGEDGETELEIADTSPTPLQLLESKETTEFVLSCLDQLPIDHKEVILLRDVQGFSYEDISEILSCSIGTVKSRINRARLRLREKILEQNDTRFV